MNKRILMVAMMCCLLGWPVFAGYPGQDPWDQSSQTDQSSSSQMEQPPHEGYGKPGYPNHGQQSGQSHQSGSYGGQYGQTNQGSGNCSGGQYDNGGSYGTSAQDVHALQAMLNLVLTDLSMCEYEVRDRRFGYINSVKAIGHINNARSALKRTQLAPAYASLQREVYDRLERIRFHLLMNDVRYTVMLCGQLRQVIRSMMRAHAGTNYSYGTNGANGSDGYGTFSQPVYAAPIVPGSTSSSSFGGGWGNGQQISVPVAPIGLVPVN